MLSIYTDETGDTELFINGIRTALEIKPLISKTVWNLSVLLLTLTLHMPNETKLATFPEIFMQNVSIDLSSDLAEFSDFLDKFFLFKK